ncbi:CHUP1-like protein [Parasponia andersonii]|uniref:CHUP1-like protein n=1 Tax=Parasponia andersonii TaxID=3476 RepID=A0A2P5C4X6_PARAD|nr:CHUP1-like protein [Parasponia andersonii]
MESSISKAEIMKPLIFKAGIPLTLSVAAFLYARMVARRSVPKDSMLENTRENSMETDSQFGSEKSFHSLSSTGFPSVEYREPLLMDTNSKNSVENLGIRDKPDFGEEILGLKSLEDLRNRERELELLFIRYNDLKEQESVLMQLRNMLSLEMAHIEFLDREVSLMEDESRRFEKLLVESLRLLEQLEYWKSQSGLLRRKVKKLLRIKKVQSSLIREKDMKIRAREGELLRTQKALETRTDLVNKLEDEVKELRMVLDQLHEEKVELLKKLELAEETSTSSFFKIDAEVIRIEEHKCLSDELEQLKKDRAAEVEELIYLRWSNACLKHELMKNQEQCQETSQKKGQWELDSQASVEIGHFGLEQELANMVLGHNENAFGTSTCDQASSSSKRKKLLQRLRKWVEGNEKGKGKVDEKERHEVRCFGRHSASDEKEEHLQGRRSCSSA